MELARCCGVPVVLHLHSGRFVEFYDQLPALARSVVRRMFAHAAHVIVLGKVWEDAVCSRLGVLREKITVLFNAVVAPHPVRRPPCPDRICHIVLLGRLGPNKGVPELLQALAGDALRGLSWRVTLAGDGDLATYRSEAAALGIGDRVALPGWLSAPAVSALLADADIMVLPSHAENLSVAVIEALAHQVAVVTTPVGATSEIVTDNEFALLIPVRDPLALAEALRRLIVCPALRDRIARYRAPGLRRSARCPPIGRGSVPAVRHDHGANRSRAQRPRPGVTTTPLVSVIVPTIRRPTLVLRAVRSVLAQTWSNLELIVLVDGPDPATVHALAAVVDRRLRILQNPVSRGAGAARNQAASVAAGAWLAFLDDDDEWLSTKLALQMAAADPATLVSCRCEVRTPRGVQVWPRRLPRIAEPVDDYLYLRRSPWRGESYLATPTFLLSAAMFAASGGFGESAQNEDTTLLLRVTKRCGGRIVMLPDVLVIVHAGLPDSLGSSFAWRESLRWLDCMADMITPPAYSGFCLITLASQAARDGDLGAIPVLLRRAWRSGSPTAMQVFLFATFWALPMGRRQRLRALWERLARRTGASAYVRPPDAVC